MNTRRGRCGRLELSRGGVSLCWNEAKSLDGCVSMDVLVYSCSSPAVPPYHVEAS